jgi:hypothetical protein
MPSGKPGDAAGRASAMQYVGGSTTPTDAKAKSFVFDNLQNNATQSDTTPFGYGRVKIGSRLINQSIKMYPIDQIFNNEIAVRDAMIPLYD